MQQRTRVALIFGGTSSEHGVSCLTAASVLAAIDQDRFDVVGVGISPSGRWTQVSLDELASYEVTEGKLPQITEPETDAV